MLYRKSYLHIVSIGAALVMLLSLGVFSTGPALGQGASTPEAQELGGGLDAGGDTATDTPSDTSLSADIPAEIDDSGKPLDVIKRLREVSLVPDGGEIVLKPLSGGSYSRSAGLQRNTYFFLGDPYKQKDTSVVQNFVLHAEIVALNLANATDSCGLLFRVKDRTNQSDAIFLSADSHFYISEAGGKKLTIDKTISIDDLPDFDPKYQLGPNTRTGVTVIAVDETVTFYVNGYLVWQSDKFKPVAGDIFMAVYGEDDTTKARICNYKNVWVWSLD